MYIYIRGMSTELRVISDNITNLGQQILKHLIRLVLYPEAREQNHWKQEIVAFLGDVPKVKGKNKFPKEKMILDALKSQNDMIDILVDQTKHNESNLVPRDDLSPHEIEDAVCIYQEWLAHELATHGAIYYDEAYAKLDEMIESTL